MQDPFDIVREEVMQSVNGARTLYARWRELLNTTNTAEDDEFKWTTQELKRVVKSIEWDLLDLDETISIVESNRAKFHMDEWEVAARRSFVSDARATVAQMKKEMDDPASRAKIERDQRASLIPSSRERTRERMEDSLHEDNESFIRAQKNKQEEMRKEEDQHLDHLERGLNKLSRMSLTIHDELEDQDELLEKFNSEVNSTTNRVSAGIKRISELIDRSSTRTSWFIILGMVGLIIFLLFVF